MDQRLVDKIRLRLVAGELPREKCQIAWFGPGTHQPCAACGRTIDANDVECGCDHPDGGVTIWDAERQNDHQAG